MLKCFPHTNIIMIVRRLFLTYVVGFHTLRWFFSYFVFFIHEFSSLLLLLVVHMYIILSCMLLVVIYIHYFLEPATFAIRRILP